MVLAGFSLPYFFLGYGEALGRGFMGFNLRHIN